jgi:hypothetical protein
MTIANFFKVLWDIIGTTTTGNDGSARAARATREFVRSESIDLFGDEYRLERLGRRLRTLHEGTTSWKITWMSMSAYGMDKLVRTMHLFGSVTSSLGACVPQMSHYY